MNHLQLPQVSLASIETPETIDDLQEILYKPFGVYEHMFHSYHGFCYLKEEAINKRLTEAFGVRGWSKVVTGEEVVAGEPYALVNKVPVPISFVQKYSLPMDEKTTVQADAPLVKVYGYIQVGDEKRYSVGTETLLSLGKTYNERLANTVKAADTDLLKRTARQWGVGLYLTEFSAYKAVTKIDVSDHDQLRKFLEWKFPNDMRFKPVPTILSTLFNTVNSEFPDVYRTEDDFRRIGGDLGLPTGKFLGDAFHVALEEFRGYADMYGQ